jgi:autotransporter-associated beta strand protein
VLFDDTAAGTTSVTVDIPVHPVSVSVNNNAKTYSITSGGPNNIAGGSSITKSGSGTLTLSGGANTYTGVTILNGGTLIVGTLANGGAVSDIGSASSTANNIVLDGGTLQYTGSGVGINRLFTVGARGGTIDNQGPGPLVFNNTGALAMTGDGSRTLTLTGPNDFGDTIASAIVNHPAGTSLTKNGVGTWTLTGTNNYGGGTMIANGVLQVGAGGSAGSLGSGVVSNNSVLVFNRTGTLLVSAPIKGTGSVTNNGTGTVILANNNTYTGGTIINAGTLQVGNGGSSGSLNPTAPIENNSLLVFNSSGSVFYGAGGSGIISGSGNLIVQGGGFFKVIGNNTYTGWTRIDANTTFQPVEGQDGTLASPIITNNGILRFSTQLSAPPGFEYGGSILGSGRLQIGANSLNTGIVTLTGTNSYTGGTFIGAHTLVLGDGLTIGAGSIAGNVQFVNNFIVGGDDPRILVFNRPEDFTFAGTITTNFANAQNNLGIVQQDGSGTLTLTGNNTYASGTIINSGAVQVGNGGTTGTIGFGPVTDHSLLIFNRADDVTFNNAISGTGAVVKFGAGRLLLNGVNTYFGTTTISNGTLGGTGVISGPVSLNPGTTLAPAGPSIGTLTINNDLTLGGNLEIEVNRSLVQSNDFVVVTGTAAKTGPGALTVFNPGPGLRVGDKFTLFSKPLQNGGLLTVNGAGATWANNLAVDGSISVISVSRPTLNMASLGNSLQFSWNPDLGAYRLQSQTNSLAVGLNSGWTDYPNGNISPVIVSIGITNETVFFRLFSP